MSRELCREIDQVIEQSNLKNNDRLYNQIDGSSGSITDSIAEGFERNGNKEFIQFLSIAKASCGEQGHSFIVFLIKLFYQKINLKY